VNPCFAEALKNIELYKQHGLATPERIRELESFISFFEDHWGLSVSRTPQGYPAVSFEGFIEYDGVEAYFLDSHWVIEWCLGDQEDSAVASNTPTAAFIFLTLARSIY
jgi:hypothetical protein